ncbi:transglycosylase domain-containing protein, partial [Cribrihabitans sp. XS_ASV171]
MTDSRRRKGPLVADKRQPRRGGKAPAGKGGKTTATKARKPAARKSARKTDRRGSGGGGGIGGAIRRFFRWVFGLIWGFVWRVGMVFGLILALAVGLTYTTLPAANTLLDGRARGSVTMLDREGEVFAWRGDQFGGVITVETVSPHLKNAIIATEDKRFYRHFGISPRGIASAVRINLSEGRGPLSGHGGSTITQQTAKLLCLGEPYEPEAGQTEAEYEAQCRAGTLWRKAKEAVYAMAMEVAYTKDEILMIY